MSLLNVYLLAFILSFLIPSAFSTDEGSTEASSSSPLSEAELIAEHVIASTTQIPYRQDNCMYCVNDSPGYSYCNHQNKTGYCCPFGSNHYECIQDEDNDVLCSYQEANPELVYSYCLQKNEFQCGILGPYLSVYNGDGDVGSVTVEITNLTWADAITCLWEITTTEKRLYVYSKTIVVEFEEIVNMNVNLFQGFSRDLDFIRNEIAVPNKTYTFPIYDHKYIQAVPLYSNNSSPSSIKFTISVDSNVVEVDDDYIVKVAVSISITFGGLAIIGIAIGSYFFWKWLKKREEYKKGKVSVKSITVLSQKQMDDDEKHKMHKADDENIDFDDNQENNTLESPKNGSGGKSSAKLNEKTKTGNHHHTSNESKRVSSHGGGAGRTKNH